VSLQAAIGDVSETTNRLVYRQTCVTSSRPAVSHPPVFGVCRLRGVIRGQHSDNSRNRC
jgi:hypothetical protein